MAFEINDVIWLASIISLSIGGTFAIIFIIKYITDYFDRRKNR